MNALQSQYDSLCNLKVYSMLRSLFAYRVVTFSEKQEIEHAEQQERKGMEWFLDNVILSSLQQGVIIKYKRFIEIMEKHDDTIIRKKAAELGK